VPLVVQAVKQTFGADFELMELLGHDVYVKRLRLRQADRDPHDQRPPHAGPRLKTWMHWDI
jgi:hypothetical protein